MNRLIKLAAVSVVALGVASQPAVAATINWTGPSDFDSAAQTFGAVNANSLTFDVNPSAWLGSGYFHDHGNGAQFTISAVINGVSTLIYSSGAVSGDLPLHTLGTINFATGSVTGISLNPTQGVGYAFHDFQQGQTFTLGLVAGGVPEPSAWALMILGFGVAGAALRARKRQTAAVQFG